MTEINLFRHTTDLITLEPGDVLFREGEAGDVMFAVADGLIDLTLNGVGVEEIGPGGIIGELALIDHAPRSATASARTKSQVARVDKDRFAYLVQEHPTFALQVMTVMAERLRKANERATTH